MKQKKIGVLELFMLCGFACFFAYYLVIFFGVFSYFPSDYSLVSRRMLQLLLFAGGLVGGLVIVRLADRFEGISNRSTLFIACALVELLIPTCVILDTYGITIPSIALGLVCILVGAAVTVTHTIWENVASKGHLRSSLVYHGLAFALGGMSFLTTSLFTTQAAQGTISAVLLVISVGFYVSLDTRCESTKNAVPKKESGEIYLSLKKLNILTFIINLAFGLTLAMMYGINKVYFFAAMGVAVLVVFIITVLYRNSGKFLPFITLLRIAIIIVTISLIGVPFAPETFSNLFLCAIVVVWFAYRMINGSLLVELATKNNFFTSYFVLRGKMPGNIGFAIGWIFGVLVLAVSKDISGVITLSIVAISVLGSMLLLPFDSTADALASVKEKSEVATDNNRDSFYVERCSELAKRYGLSPRENEVLFFIVKGRNAKYIAEKLFISESTVKTHMFNVYKKTGIHSQQQFIDLMDD